MTKIKKALVNTLIIIFLIALFSIGLVLYKDRTYFHSSPYKNKTNDATDILVVYYSRSGNTEAMARQIARSLRANIRSIKTDKYTLDLKGQREAGNDADLEVLPPVSPSTIDLSQYRLILLGSPIWWYRPATPLWSFVENNDFTGKKVILFNTFNSRFKPEKIEQFRYKIEQQGGKMVDHIYVRRGRVFFQKDGDDIISET
jgi:flavodoxin